LPDSFGIGMSMGNYFEKVKAKDYFKISTEK
jgi:hypothetical protein